MGLLLMNIRVGGMALVGVGLVFSIIGLIGNAVRRKRPLIIVAEIAVLVGFFALVCGAVNYDRYLPTYTLFKEAMEVKAQQDQAHLHLTPSSTKPHQ